MTEDDWLRCTAPEPMLTFLLGKTSDRKLRIFACYCLRQVWHLLNDLGKRLVEAFERQVAGLAEESGSLAPMSHEFADYLQTLDPHANVHIAGCGVQQMIAGAAWAAAWNVASETRRAIGVSSPNKVYDMSTKQASLFRELIGNPFRPSTHQSGWLSPTVKELSQFIYAHGDFDALVILSDALEEAGCSDAALLAHLRAPGPHVRGCWALDIVLQKE
jgi:hypothetical protein